MQIPGSFLLVATLLAATGAAITTEAVAAAKSDAAQMQVLRHKAGLASSVGPAILVLAAR